MFMKNVEFENTKTENVYNKIVETQQSIEGVISLLSQRGELKIINILINSNNVLMDTKLNGELMNIEIDLNKNKILVISPNKSCVEVYNNFPKKNLSPLAVEYHSGNKSIVRQNIFEYEYDDENKYYYTIQDNNCNYSIIIKDKNENFNEEEFVKAILYSNIHIGNIRDLLMIISNYMNNRLLNISLADGLGSIIVINYGKVTKYIEYRDMGDEYQKVYLDDDEFYVEKKVKEVYNDNLTSYIKKLGEYHGKEKR